MRLGGYAANFVALVAVAGAVTAIAGCDAAEGGTEPKRGVVAVVLPGGENPSGALQDVTGAVRDTLSGLRIDGWTLDVSVRDSATVSSDELADDDVVAVIGGYSADAVRRLAPELAGASVLFVSPFDHERAHTRGADPMTSVRPYGTYYTTALDEDDPLEFLASYAIQGMDLESFALFDVGGTESVSERRDFSRYVREIGADVAVSRRAGDDVPNAVESALDEAVDAMFVAGEPAAAAALVNEARSAGLDVPLMVSPSLVEGDFLADVGTVGEAVSVQEPASHDRPSGSTNEASGPYTAAARDAAKAVRIVLERCLPSASSARDSRVGCAGEMREVAFEGATGDVAFNEYGERLDNAAKIVVAADGEWAAPE